jgi:error-prone DNA polymerase
MYAELWCKTNFSFLEGASHPDELVNRAAQLGYRALAIADRQSLAGIVRAHAAAKTAGLKLLVGAEVTPTDGAPLLLIAMNLAGYRNLSRLLTRGRRAAPKGECTLTVADVADHAANLLAVVLPTSPGVRYSEPLGYPRGYRDLFGERAYFAAAVHLGPNDDAALDRLAELARHAQLPLVASNQVHYHDPARRRLHEVLTAVRHHTTVAELGSLRFPNGERHLKSPARMAELFARYPEAIARTIEVADRCCFSLDELRYEYPEELCPPESTPTAYLAELTWAGARERYPHGIPDKVRALLEKELALIAELRYEAFFLTVWDLVRYANERDILCQGRGSAANSAVCYCLGITSVDPDCTDLLFERFISKERDEAPDIDVDFEHERREEVFQYIYQKYGRDRAGIVAEVICYRPRSAVRDVGKALGLSLDGVDRLAKSIDWSTKPTTIAERIQEAGFDPRSAGARHLVSLAQELFGFPRHLSQHVGGFVITRGPLSEMVPIENAAMPDRTVIEWDKDDLDTLGILKVDCLSLGMLTAIHKCFDLVDLPARSASDGAMRQDTMPRRLRSGLVEQKLTLANVPAEDPVVYDMICAADTIGVFQIESRAQMSMLPRLQPRCFYDLVVEVAIVRPGPIQGGMVHPYLRRRTGEEVVTYPHPLVEQVLSKTLGVPLFQEQVMRLAIVAAGFTPGEADQLRRAMAAWKRPGQIEKFQAKFRDGLLARGFPAEFADQIYEQIRGFGEYGFPESHAASFARLAYISAWLKCHHPAAFTAALLNSQPMGFYEPSQLIRDAQAHGVAVLPIDVNHSDWDCTLEKDLQLTIDNYQLLIEEGLPRSQTPFGNAGWETPFPVPTRDSVPCQDAKQSFANVRSQTEFGNEQKRPPQLSIDNCQLSIVNPPLRLGLRLIHGLPEARAKAIVAARAEGAYRSVADVARRGKVPHGLLARLASADAFGSLGLDRRSALWKVLATGEELPLFAGLEEDDVAPPLPTMSLPEQVSADYHALGLSLKAHPIGLVRADLDLLNVVSAARLPELSDKDTVRVAGLVLVRQRPPTANGTVFMTLEDETGLINLIIWARTWERYRKIARQAVALVIEGKVERADRVIHVCPSKIEDLSSALRGIKSQSRDFR